MNGHNSVFGPMMRHGETYGYSLHVHDAGPSPIEWAILGLAIAILVIASLLLFDVCQRRRRRQRFWSDQGGHDKPLAILRLRYARGEISQDEYSQALADLSASHEPTAVPADNAETKPEEAQPKRRRGRK
ncbi:MAG: SHOCT domain-containing protein [Gaiellaceae bacterium]|jgi:uncharacterized membrane protein